MGDLIDGSGGKINLVWEDYLDKIEINYKFERYYSTIYYKEAEEDPDYCSCRSDDEQDLKENPIKWVSHSNQFFNSVQFADEKLPQHYTTN